MLKQLAVVAAALSVLATVSPFALVAADEGKSEPDGGAYLRQIRPLMQKYCNECHEGPEAKADIDLTRYKSAKDAIRDLDTWELVYDMVEAQRMPPAKSPQPTRDEARVILQWIERYVFGVECGEPRPGRVTVRRLNRVEYNNTIRDLLYIDVDFTDRLPADEVGYGFDNIADVLSVSPLLLEKYLDCALMAVERAIVAPDPPPAVVHAGKELRGGGNHRLGRILTSTAAVQTAFTVRDAGWYDLVFELTADQAGDEKARAELRLDGKPLRTVTVQGEGEPLERFRIRMQLAPGKHVVAVRFVNDYYKPDAPDPDERDRNLIVGSIALIGPRQLASQERLPLSHRKLLECNHQERRPHDLECARQILRRFASRAFRRPVTHDELQRLLRLVDRALADGQPFEVGIQVAMSAALVSPHFLYRIELDPPTAKEGSVRPLNGYELATRLSYFLWSTMPDEQLYELAKRGELTKPQVLTAQVRRMLQDPRASQLVQNFGDQWLQLRNLAQVNPNPQQFPEFNEALRQAMWQETRLFFETIMREDRSVLEFIDADYTWVNEALAKLYGIEGVKGDEFRRVKLEDPNRGGVITQASVLTVTSNPTRTSPVKRGKWILETILGSPPPPPPPGAPPLGEEPVTGKTLKERLQKHRENPTCAVCHDEMDTLGFALENFGPIGQWRDTDNGLPIDPSGTLPGGVSVSGPADLKRVLLERKEQFVEALVKKLLTYAIGRGLTAQDQCAVDEIVQYAAERGYRFSAVIEGVVLSEPFRLRSLEPDR